MHLIVCWKLGIMYQVIVTEVTRHFVWLAVIRLCFKFAIAVGNIALVFFIFLNLFFSFFECPKKPFLNKIIFKWKLYLAAHCNVVINCYQCPIYVLMVTNLGAEVFYNLMINFSVLIHLRPWLVIFRSICLWISSIKWNRKNRGGWSCLIALPLVKWFSLEDSLLLKNPWCSISKCLLVLCLCSKQHVIPPPIFTVRSQYNSTKLCPKLQHWTPRSFHLSR